MKNKLLLASCLAVGCASAQEADTAKDGRPSVLFILSDDHTSQTCCGNVGFLTEYAQTEHNLESGYMDSLQIL